MPFHKDLTGADVHETRVDILANDPVTLSTVASAAGIVVEDNVQRLWVSNSIAAGDWTLVSDGAQGAQGDQGAQGAQGAQGDQGSQGNQGNQGSIGAILVFTSAGSQGSQGPTETLVVTGLLHSDTILAVTPLVQGIGAQAITQVANPQNDAIDITWTGDPGAQASVFVSVLR